MKQCTYFWNGYNSDKADEDIMKLLSQHGLVPYPSYRNEFNVYETQTYFDTKDQKLLKSGGELKVVSSATSMRKDAKKEYYVEYRRNKFYPMQRTNLQNAEPSEMLLSTLIGISTKLAPVMKTRNEKTVIGLKNKESLDELGVDTKVDFVAESLIVDRLKDERCHFMFPMLRLESETGSNTNRTSKLQNESLSKSFDAFDKFASGFSTTKVEGTMYAFIMNNLSSAFGKQLS